jgi:hypothetical protein
MSATVTALSYGPFGDDFYGDKECKRCKGSGKLNVRKGTNKQAQDRAIQGKHQA